jgi:hypothetical protein
MSAASKASMSAASKASMSAATYHLVQRELPVALRDHSRKLSADGGHRPRKQGHTYVTSKARHQLEPICDKKHMSAGNDK